MEDKKIPCCCNVVLGVLVILFAWWKVVWGSIALTILGVVIILKELASQCCCKNKECKPKAGN
jgi:hypothetical protein